MADKTHADFEIAIERELHGALDAPEVRSLAEHLLGCASCRAYQQAAMEMETNMNAAGSLLSQTSLRRHSRSASSGGSDIAAHFWGLGS